MGGGISYIANRHGEASNKYMPKDDASKPSKFTWCPWKRSWSSKKPTFALK